MRDIPLCNIVKVPDVPGKIVINKRATGNYVLYENGRRYDKQKKYNVPDRTMIGIQIPSRPEYMVPNENYFRLFPKGDQNMSEYEQNKMDEYKKERDEAFMIRDFFEQMFYEFQFHSRKQPNTVLNEFKVRELNAILEPMKDMMQDEPGARFLQLIPIPTEEESEGGGTVLCGMTYSDVMMVLTKYRCTEGEFFQKMLLRET